MWSISQVWKKRDNGDWELAPNVFETPSGSKTGKWLTYGDGDQNFEIGVKCRIQWMLYAPGGSSSGTTWTNTITARPENTVVSSSDEPALILHDPTDSDPNTAASATHTLEWDVVHQAWCHGLWPDEHLHTTLSIRPVTAPTGWSGSWTLRQDHPGAGSIEWDGALPAPQPAAAKGIYTWQVTANHMCQGGGACPHGCAHFAECPSDTDKAGRVATVNAFEYVYFDAAAGRLYCRVRYTLSADVGKCLVRIYSPNLEEAMSWDAPPEGCLQGQHESQILRIDAANDGQGGVLYGNQYCAVAVTKQTAEDGLQNRDRVAKWHLPHGKYGVTQSALSGIQLWSVAFDKGPALQMHWPVWCQRAYEHGQLCDCADGVVCYGANEGVGLVGPHDVSPEWTSYHVRQHHFLLHPYRGSPDPAFAVDAPKREPASVPRNTRPAVTATILGPPNVSVLVRAVGGLGGLTEDDVAFGDDGAGMYNGQTVGDASTCVATVTPEWQWQYDAGAGWVDFASSAHVVHVTWGAPSGYWQQLGDEHYVQAVEWSCAWAGGGYADEYVFDHIWQRIGVHKDPQYRYYDNGDGSRDYLDALPAFFPASGGAYWLLAYERGRCNHYAGLMAALCGAQGIPVDVVEVHAAPAYDGFHVKNYPDSTAGVAAHATADPGQKAFSNHFICWWGTRRALFDPSYSIAATGGDDQGDEALLNYELLAIGAVADAGLDPQAPDYPWVAVGGQPPPPHDWLAYQN